MNPMYRALFLCMFQAALGMAEFQYWNLNGLESLRSQLSRGDHPIRIDLPGRKQNFNVKPYFTFIGKDGIEAVKYWFKIRPEINSPVIFLSRDGTPPAPRTIRDYWMRYLRRLGFVVPKKGSSLKTRYGKSIHELRDARAQEQYLIAEPWLNILSEDPETVPLRDLNAHRLHIRELEAEVQRLRNGQNLDVENLQAQLITMQNEMNKDRELLRLLYERLKVED